MSTKHISFESKYFLNDDWEPLRAVEPVETVEPMETKLMHFMLNTGVDEEEWLEEQWLDWVRIVHIELAEAAETRRIGSDDRYEYYESEIGMNIIVPKGNIEELRYHVTLLGGDIVAVDGFPKDVINEIPLIAGRVQVCLNKAFMFIPVVGGKIAELLEIELNPWEFRIGNLKMVHVDFSGGLTSKPGWYFKKNGIKDDLRVALTIRKPIGLDHIEGRVKAGWV